MTQYGPTEMPYARPEQFADGWNDHARQVLAAMRNNLILVMRLGTDEAVAVFCRDLVETFDSHDAARQWANAVIVQHNVRYGYSDFVRNRWRTA